MLTRFLRGGVVLACVTAMAAATAGAQPPRPQPPTGAKLMDITRKADMRTVDGPAQYFTGKATITGQFQREAPSRVSGAIVHFEPVARTAWHTHPLWQTLVVTEGVGWTQIEGGPVLEFYAGDVLWCPAEQKHWHGAPPTTAMPHIAIQESLNGSPVTWMEH